MAANEELREFLRSRRGRLEPADVGLPLSAGPRRVSGLRREELAALAGVSVDYYVRLEQGRDVNASADVLDAIARALQLDDDERTHLFDLVRPARSRRRAAPAQRVRPAVRALIDSLATPAFVLGRRMDVLASNQMTHALLCDFGALAKPERNMARWFFLEPTTRELYRDWEAVGRENVAILRMDAGRHPDDSVLSGLIGELTVKSPEFGAWWADHDVLRRSHGTKRYHHPVVGDVSVAFEGLSLPTDADQTLFIYSVESGSPSQDAMRLLASWTAEPRAPADQRPRTATDPTTYRSIKRSNR